LNYSERREFQRRQLYYFADRVASTPAAYRVNKSNVTRVHILEDLGSFESRRGKKWRQQKKKAAQQRNSLK
jgi:hypothetical protein